MADSATVKFLPAIYGGSPPDFYQYVGVIVFFAENSIQLS